MYCIDNDVLSLVELLTDSDVDSDVLSLNDSLKKADALCDSESLVLFDSLMI